MPSLDDRLVELVLDTKSLLDSYFDGEEICDEVKFTMESGGSIVSIPYYLECCCYTTHTTYWIELEGSDDYVRNIEIKMNIGREGEISDSNDDRNIQSASIEIAFYSNESCPSDFSTFSGAYNDEHMMLHDYLDPNHFFEGGSNTHYHGSIDVIIEDSTTSIPTLFREGAVGEDDSCATQGHSHTFSGTATTTHDTVDVRVETYGLHLCHYDVEEKGYPGINPQFLVPSVYSSKEITTNKYQLHNPYSGSFPAASSTDEVYYYPGDSTTHNHYFEGTSGDYTIETGYAASYALCDDCTVNCDRTCLEEHTHKIQPVWLSIESNEPLWVSFPFFQPYEYKEKPFNGSMIPVFDLVDYDDDYVIPFFYEALTGYEWYFVKMSDEPFETGGEDGHSHSVSVFATSESDCPDEITSHISGDHLLEDLTHNHQVEIESSYEYNEPPYYRIMLFQRKTADLTYIIDYHSYESNSWECYTESFNSSLACRSRGDCMGQDYCECNENYYGVSCSESFGMAEYEDSKTISIEYEVLVGDLELFSYRNETIKVLFGDEEDEEDEDDDDYFDCGLFIKDSEEKLGDHIKCQFRAENIVSTTHLVVYKAKEGVDSIVLMPFTETGVEIELGIGQFKDANYLAVVVIGTPIIASSVIIICCVCCCCVYCLCCFAFCYSCCIFCVCNRSMRAGRKLKKVGKLDDLDVLLQEQKAVNRSRKDKRASAQLKIRKELFEVNYKDIKVLQQIGAGGSNSVVFKARWEGQEVAFKVFKTNDICSEQHKFEEFEREVQILASFSHPNILNFYGASIMTPRVGILMEFCSRGDLQSFLPTYMEENNGVRYPERIRMMTEIIQAMAYLHDSRVIHRDLKLENILVTEGYTTKVMDFGLSKVVERISQTMTKRIGTSLTMAPEVTRGDAYTPACDVFSFGIMCYQMLSYIMDPYGKNVAHNLEFKVANNSNFRPPLRGTNEDGIEIVFGSANIQDNYSDDEDEDSSDEDSDSEKKKIKKRVFRHQWLVNLIMKMWDDDPEERPSFEELTTAFDEKKDVVERLNQRKKFQSLEEANLRLEKLNQVLDVMSEANVELKKEKREVMNEPLIKRYFEEQRRGQHERILKVEEEKDVVVAVEEEEEEEEEEIDSGDEEVIFSSSSSSSSSSD